MFHVHTCFYTVFVFLSEYVFLMCTRFFIFKCIFFVMFMFLMSVFIYFLFYVHAYAYAYGNVICLVNVSFMCVSVAQERYTDRCGRQD